jgi:hypothetical protein
MAPSAPTTRPLTPPREAAIAGLLFSVLLIVSLGIIRLALPDVSVEERTIKPGFEHAIRLALNLVPFAGIAFLWFLGVLRNRLGAAEDQFFATVFLGSGLLFVVSLFASAAVAGAVLVSSAARSTQEISNGIYYFAQEVSHAFLNVFAVKMAGVFIFSTCTIALRTAIFPRWIAFLGFACGLALLLIISNWLWIALLFPIWTTVVSLYLLTVTVR